MSFDKNRESGCCHNNTLENKLMRPYEVCLEYKFVTLHRVFTHRYLQRGWGAGACCPLHSCPCQYEVAERVTAAPTSRQVTFLSCAGLTQRYVCHSVTLLVREKDQEEQTSLPLGDLWPCTCNKHGGRATITVQLRNWPKKSRNYVHIPTPSLKKIIHVQKMFGGVMCYGHTACLSLIVWSSGRPGHLRLLPDNEYDEDG